MLAENELKTLACGTPAHGDMDHFIGSPSGSMWICKRCGLLAVHLQTTSDIWWYTAFGIDQPLPHRAGCAYCSTRFDCSCNSPGQRHMCPRCDAEAEESKTSGEFPTPDGGEVAQDRAASGPRYPEDLTPAETGAGSTDDF